MSTRLDNKVIVITGAASGMGRAATLRFLDEGAAVVAADLNVKTGNETIKLAHDAGHQNIKFVRTDVTQESDIAILFRCSSIWARATRYNPISSIRFRSISRR